jgi:hypothetical protein
MVWVGLQNLPTKGFRFPKSARLVMPKRVGQHSVQANKSSKPSYWSSISVFLFYLHIKPGYTKFKNESLMRPISQPD